MACTSLVLLTSNTQLVNACEVTLNLPEAITGEATDYTLAYSDSVGYYLATDINQGLEFIILGEQNADALSDMGFRTARMSGSYYNPSEFISKMEGGKYLEGVWWGGFVNDLFTGSGGAVAASTKASSARTQSKASVKAGTLASWVSSAWANINEIASVAEVVGISGNQAKWDLRSY